MKRKALLIGINKYQTLGKLSFARQDAEAFAESLCDNYGFSSHDINLMTCQAEGAGAAFSRYVELAISDLVEYKDLDLLVFGFWGHGFAPQPGKRYLCGLDTILDDLERTAVSMDVIKAKLSQVGAENTLLVLDCCQNNPTGRSVEAETLSRGEEAELSSLARDIQTARREESRMTIPTVAVLNSCREGQRAYEWQQREHGIFTAHLLDQMSSRVSSVAQLASSIFDPVMQTAMNLHRQKQTPFVVIEGKGDIPLIGAETSKKENDGLLKATLSCPPISENTNDISVPIQSNNKQCPQCGFSFKFNGFRCDHCGYDGRRKSINGLRQPIYKSAKKLGDKFICPGCGEKATAGPWAVFCTTCNAFVHNRCTKGFFGGICPICGERCE